MGTSIQLLNSAHNFGLDNMGVTPALISGNLAIQGSVLQTTTSWGNGPIQIGQSGVITVTLSGGFTQKIGLVYDSADHGTLTFLQLSRTATSELLVYSNASIGFTQATLATALQPESMFAGADTVSGNAYDNVLRGYAGNDRIDGGAGTDTAVFSGFASQYQIAQSGNAIATSGVDGSDTLLNMERLQFDDKSIAFDTDGNAGMAYRIYQAAFDRVPDKGGLGFWIHTLDIGVPLANVADGFEKSGEFLAKYGAHPTNSAMVSQFYQNVLHRTPDQGGLSFWVNLLDNHTLSAADVLVGFSESAENKAQLIGAIQHGIEYYPVA